MFLINVAHRTGNIPDISSRRFNFLFLMYHRSSKSFRELNVNSAIAKPDHNEKLYIDKTPASYPIQGYAYAGGGRKVTRVEVSLDEGETWTLANMYVFTLQN